jgi:uncharacterized membrane protein YkgB
MNTKQTSILLARIALSVIYFWFGILKVLGQSPASEMVNTLLSKTVSFIPFSSFIVLFGLFEVAIGVLFFVPKMEKVALGLFAAHMVMCALPLLLMSQVWTRILVPTLEGQYIIKNLALISCAVTIWASLEPKKFEPSNSVLPTL